MLNSGYPKLVFNQNECTVTTTGDGTIVKNEREPLHGTRR